MTVMQNPLCNKNCVCTYYIKCNVALHAVYLQLLMSDCCGATFLSDWGIQGGVREGVITVGANDQVPCSGLKQNFHSEGGCEYVVGNDDLQATTRLA